MGIIGFNFTKINVEKTKTITGKVNISNNVALKDVESMQLPENLGSQKGLKFVFAFVSKYEPGIGFIELHGEVLYFDKADKAEAILKDWKDTRKIDGKIMESVMNHILTKCNIESLILARDMNLPPQIQLPKVTRQVPAKETTVKKK